MNHSQRVLKKISTPFDAFRPTAAVLMVNMVDPQVRTMQVFLEAIEEAGIPFVAVGNKVDLVNGDRVRQAGAELGIDLIPASVLRGDGLQDIEAAIADFGPGSRVVVLGVFNSGKTSLIAALTGLELATGNLPGTTLEFSAYPYGDQFLIDTVGQVIDVNKPLMVSVASDVVTIVVAGDTRVIVGILKSISTGIETGFEGLAPLAEAANWAWIVCTPPVLISTTIDGPIVTQFPQSSASILNLT